MFPSSFHVGGIRPSPAITFWFIRVSLVGKGGLVVRFDDAGYIWEAAIAYFDIVSVKYFVKFL